ncbi:unnamed protein product [Spirodela intermedia]|uniref:Reticulon-like protein n=1 Tax=Spirodela intermedia TaxID=51605 RepID=A0A7I8L3C6_SPIIN|nr:unnamed protein product [Spirodela intermedia]
MQFIRLVFDFKIICILSLFLLSPSIKGSSVVFFMDMLDSSLQDFYDQYIFIVQGTKNVISACHDCEVERLIYNSSADVVFDGVHDIFVGNESLQYPYKFEDVLCDLKVHAEALILSANTADGLSTCALRPCNPFGPGDSYLVPSLVDGAKSAWAKFFIGTGSNMCDYTYVENIAHAHMCAENALRCRIASVAGEPFFITNLQPMKSGDFASLLLSDLGFPRFSFHLPLRLVLLILMLVGWVCKTLVYPRTRISFLRSFFCTRTFDCSKAQKHIGYSPIISLEDGIALTTESFPHLVKDSPHSRECDLTRISKVEKLFGSGKVTDILLWRDEKKTFICALGLFLLFYWFLLSGRTLVTATAELLFLASVILFGFCHLPSSLLGAGNEKISPSYFAAPETSVRAAVASLSSLWNRGVRTVSLLARGEDASLLFKVGAALCFFKLLLRLSPVTLIGAGLVSLFTVFIIYDRHEDQVDAFVRKAAARFSKAGGLLLRNLRSAQRRGGG